MAIKTIKGATGEIKHRVANTQQQLVNLVHRRARYSVSSNLVMNLGFSVAYLFTFIWGTYHLSVGLITYGALIAFVQLVAQIQRPARSLVKFIPDIINTLTSGERILEIKEASELGVRSEELGVNPIFQTSNLKFQTTIGIRLSNVTFGYSEERNVLENFSYDFPPTSRTAIMGPTGQGKTTLIRIILGLIQPIQGNVEFYNSQSPLRSPISFAYVPQGNTLFSGSIRSNLLLASPTATDQQLTEALRMAQANFVFRLADGLSSQCGEHGIALSEGQAQRLCIARALLIDAPVLLLDEATSALDPDTEAAVLHNICTTLTDKTIICVSHRPKVLDYCTQQLKL